MAKKTDPSSGGWAGIDWSQFLTGENQTRIDFGKLSAFGVKSVISALFTGVVSVILGFADIPLALLSGLATFTGELVYVVAGIPAAFVRGSFAEATAFVLDAGLAGYVVSIAIMLASFYTIALVVSHVR